MSDEADAALSREAAETGVAPRILRDSSLYLVGTGTELRDRIERWRGEVGITYVSLFDPAKSRSNASPKSSSGRSGHPESWQRPPGNHPFGSRSGRGEAPASSPGRA